MTKLKFERAFSVVVGTVTTEESKKSNAAYTVCSNSPEYGTVYNDFDQEFITGIKNLDTALICKEALERAHFRGCSAETGRHMDVSAEELIELKERTFAKITDAAKMSFNNNSVKSDTTPSEELFKFADDVNNLKNSLYKNIIKSHALGHSDYKI